MALARGAGQVFGEGNVVVTGHSLGGGLASAAALATGASGVTFNAAGLSNETLESLGFNPNAVRDSVSDSGQLRRYIVNGDPLNAAQQDIPILPILNMSPPNALGHELRVDPPAGTGFRSEEHTSELQSLMRISYDAFCLKQKNDNNKK